MKNKKLWIPLTALALVAAVAAGAILIPRTTAEPVPVFPVSMLSYTGSESTVGESYGVVAADKVQSVYVSSTQTVTRIHVYQGQKVKKGDVLYSYDTTLSDLTLERKDLAIQQMEINLKNAREELTKLKAMKPMVVTESSSGSVSAEYGKSPSDPEYLDSIYSGSGTSSNPYRFWISQGTPIYEDLIWEIIGYSGRSQVYVVFQLSKNDAANAEFIAQYGVRFDVLEVESEEPEQTEPTEPEQTGGSSDQTEEPQVAAYRRSVEKIYVMTFFDPGSKKDTGAQIDWNSGYTQAELVTMREEKAEEIAELEFNIRISKAELKIMEKEASDGNVYAEFDGTVVSVLEPENARELGAPMLKITGGGGYYVEGKVSELLLDTIEVGQSVTVSCWDTGTVYTGSVASVGEYPTESDEYSYSAANVTYYPYRVFIDEAADLQEGAYVSLTYRSGQSGEKRLYLENAFICTEGRDSFVYLRGEDGTLEKRFIETGVSVDGYATPVYSGLTEDDYIAFPYSKDVREGAETVEAGVAELYGS